MNHPVFISYARSASSGEAERLHHALGGEKGLAFLDTSGIAPGEGFPRVLAEALLASRVVVVFASKEYFRRWYCLWELEAALGPFLALGPGAADAEKQAALAPLLLALPSKGMPSLDLMSLPPALRNINWPTADDAPRLEALVRKRLADSPATLGERLDAAGRLGTELRARLLTQKARPEPKSLAGARVYPGTLLPTLGDSFVGREDELWRIHYTLSVLQDRRGKGGAVAGAALTGALHAAGGFGKTRLALEYLHRLGPSHYPGGLFWVNADVGPDRLEEQFHGILRTLVPDAPELVEFRERGRSVAREMAGALEKVAARERVLYVVDNVPEPGPEDAPAPLGTWCPVMGKVSLLATSRARLDLGTEGVYALPVSVLASDAAVALLTDGISRALLSEDAWGRIAEWVGHLPLALELLNRAMRSGGLEPEELLSRAEGQGPARELDQQRQWLRRHVPRGSSLRGVAEAFSLSYERLSEAEQRAARLIAQLAPEPIPMDLLKALGPEASSSEVRATLRSRHFVVPVEKSEAGVFGSMHRVLADYLRSQSADPAAELDQVCQGLAVMMEPAASRDPRTWSLLESCLPHAESVFQRLMERSVPSECELQLGLSMGHLLSARGLAGRARSIEEKIVARAHDAFGSEHPDTLTAMNNLAHTLWTQGNHAEARMLQERVLEVRRRVLGQEHLDTLTAMNNLANTIWAQGNYAEARTLQERVLEVMRRVLGEEHRDTLSVMNNLAHTLWAQGDYAGARVLQERVLEVMLRVLGEEHPVMFTAMNNLANTLWSQGELAGARALQERVLEIRLRVLGEEHPDTLRVMNNLAKTLWSQGELARARALQERVVEVQHRAQGDEHPDTLLAMDNLAIVLRALGDMTGAERLERKSRELRQRRRT